MWRTIPASAAALTVAALVSQLIIGLPADGQTWQTDQLMQQKLAHSERLLAALVQSHWLEITRDGRALQDITMQPGWDVMRLPEFNRHTTAFQRATAALINAAEARDAGRALTAYNGLVASCVACHGYVARARIARPRVWVGESPTLRERD